MDKIIQDLTVVAVGLLILGGAYLINLVIGVAKVIFTPKLTFSWRVMLQGFIKVLLMSIGILGFTVVLNLLTWFGHKIGADLTFLQPISMTGLLAAVIAGSAYYLTGAFQNIVKFLNEHNSEVPKIDEASYEKGAKEITEVVEKAIETITKRSNKEQLKKDGVKIDDGIDIEPGRGSANTYPAQFANASPDTLTDPSTCYNRECVSYTAWKIAETGKGWPRRTGDMNAKSWVSRMPENGYVEVSGNDMLNGLERGGRYVGILPSGRYGHALWAESRNGGSVNISEYNYASAHNYGQRTISPAGYRWYQIISPSSAPAPQPSAPAPQPSAPAPSSPKLGANDLANAIRRGDFGNGSDRINNLHARGYSDAEINEAQAIVNGALAPAPSPSAPEATGNVQVGDRVVSTSSTDQNGVSLNMSIINDGRSVYTGNNSRGFAVIARDDGAVRAAVPLDSLRKL